MLTADHFDRDGLYIVQLGDGTLTAIEVQATYADAGADGIAPIIRIVIEVGLSGRIPLPSWIGSMRKTANGVILARYVDPEKNIFGPEFTFDLRRCAESVATGRIIVDAGNPIALAELEIQANGSTAGNLRVWIGDTNGARPAAWADWDTAGQSLPSDQEKTALTPDDFDFGYYLVTEDRKHKQDTSANPRIISVIPGGIHNDKHVELMGYGSIFPLSKYCEKFRPVRAVPVAACYSDGPRRLASEPQSAQGIAMPADPVPHGAEWFRAEGEEPGTAEWLWVKYKKYVGKALPIILPEPTATAEILGETEKRYWFDMGDAVICRTASGDIVYHPAPNDPVADATGDGFEPT
jgi:hypothetical protein